MPTADAIAGAVAGAAECLAVQPLDMVKTRYQLAASSADRPAVLRAIRSIVREGGVSRLYRGVLPELVAMTPKSGAMYASYEAALRTLRSTFMVLREDGAALHFAAGFAAGVPEAAVVTPFQVAKMRTKPREESAG